MNNLTLTTLQTNKTAASPRDLSGSFHISALICGQYLRAANPIGARARARRAGQASRALATLALSGCECLARAALVQKPAALRADYHRRSILRV